MRITLIGCGKTGQIVEKVARAQGHEIVHISRANNPLGSPKSQEAWSKKSDVLIDFSVAHATVNNVQKAVEADLPIVVGTTGWHKEFQEVHGIVQKEKGSCVYSSNFSLGVQILFYLTREAGKLISRFGNFHPYIVEAHHHQKIDAPSGTALSLKDTLKKVSHLDTPISSVRSGFFPGTHLVGFDSSVDTLTLKHTARNREGFARGALLAAEWLLDRKGFYSFEEILFGEEND